MSSSMATCGRLQSQKLLLPVCLVQIGNSVYSSLGQICRELAHSLHIASAQRCMKQSAKLLKTVVELLFVVIHVYLGVPRPHKFQDFQVQYEMM